MTPGAPAVAGILLVTAGLLAAGPLMMRAVAHARRRVFLERLGKVVRIGTPCRVVHGRVLLPGTVALTPQGIAWDSWPTAAGSAGSLTFEETRRLESDDALLSGRRFRRAKVVRVTSTSDDVHEFVVSPGHAWEWRQALGEWTASNGKLRGS